MKHLYTIFLTLLNILLIAAVWKQQQHLAVLEKRVSERPAPVVSTPAQQETPLVNPLVNDVEKLKSEVLRLNQALAEATRPKIIPLRQ
ncbi:MAG: hypothetical protein IPK32_13380 [Verrucomicrobiaceae bacterium]|nr:hypothetical protein [Verrucomicrobiaceae bacterium]